MIILYNFNYQSKIINLKGGKISLMKKGGADEKLKIC